MTHPNHRSVILCLLSGLVAVGCSSGGGGGGGAAPTGVLSSGEQVSSSPSGPLSQAPSNDESASEAVASDPPASDPPASDPPASDPPASDPPASDPPASDPPASDPPAPSDPADLTPSPETRKVYVSSSTGDDAFPGTIDQPVKSIAAGVALLRNGQPDWLLLKKGDVWDEAFGQWRLSGASASEPMVVWTYGTGARPLLRTGAAGGLQTSGSSGGPASNDHLVFSGIHFQAHTRMPNAATFTGTAGASGIHWLRGTQGVLIDDCVFESYTNGIVFIDFDDYGQTNITLRRCLVLDSYNDAAHSQGVFLDKVKQSVVEECIIDHNGWNATLYDAGANPTIFNHGVYVQSSCRDITFRNNIVLRSSSHGLQLRPGGTCTGNVFVRNPINILIGGGDSPVPGGVDGLCAENVVVEGTDISATGPRGWGIDLVNIKTATVRDNIVAHLASTNTVNAFAIDSDALATYANNTVWSWIGSPAFDSTGPFVDPDVSVAKYAGLNGAPATLEGFVAKLRAQSRASYDPAFGAAAIRAYFKAGFTPN